MTYFRDELVQLIVSRSDSDLEVQRHGMKKNMLTVDPIMLQDEFWTRQREKPSPNRRSQFFENRTAETEFSVFEFWGRFGSVFRKPIPEIFIRFRTSLLSGWFQARHTLKTLRHDSTQTEDFWIVNDRHHLRTEQHHHHRWYMQMERSCSNNGETGLLNTPTR